MNYFSHLFLSNSILYFNSMPCMKMHSHILVTSYGLCFQYLYIHHIISIHVWSELEQLQERMKLLQLERKWKKNFKRRTRGKRKFNFLETTNRDQYAFLQVFVLFFFCFFLYFFFLSCVFLDTCCFRLFTYTSYVDVSL